MSKYKTPNAVVTWYKGGSLSRARVNGSDGLALVRIDRIDGGSLYRDYNTREIIGNEADALNRLSMIGASLALQCGGVSSIQYGS